MSDSVGDMANKAKEKMAGHEDEVDGAMDKAADKANDATGGKFDDAQVDKAKNAAKENIDKMNK